MRVRRPLCSESSIPTSSMADLAFLLLIFFMVTGVFAATRGLELDLPPDEPGAVEPEPGVLIQVGLEGIEVDCRPMALDELLPYLEPRLTRNPNKPVILVTASDAPYSAMVAVYDRLSETRTEESAWPFEVRNLQLPTRTELERYEALFGQNPFEAACAE